MVINFKKLNSQIKPFKKEAKRTGCIFIATEKQKRIGIDSIAMCGSKRSLLRALVYFIKEDEDYNKEFTL